MSRLACLIALSALATAAANFAPGSHPAAIPAASADTGTHCEVRVYKRGGGTSVEGVLYASGPIAGSYRLSVTGGPPGVADNDESGAFNASPTGATSLGQITVGPGSRSAHMTVRWKGGETTCAQHVGP